VRVLEEYSYSSMAGRGGGGKGREGREGNEKRKREKIYTHAERVRVGENCGFCMVRKDIDGVLTLLWVPVLLGPDWSMVSPREAQSSDRPNRNAAHQGGPSLFPFLLGTPSIIPSHNTSTPASLRSTLLCHHTSSPHTCHSAPHPGTHERTRETTCPWLSGQFAFS